LPLKEQFRFNTFAIPLLFLEAFLMLQDEHSYSLLTKVHVLRYQPSCHNSFHLAITFKSVATKILFQRWKIQQLPSYKSPWYNHNQNSSFS